MKIRVLAALVGCLSGLFYPPVTFAATLLPPGEQCFVATTGLSGMVGFLGSITGGSGYVSGSYGGVSLTGGSGSGATANITVTGGTVTSVTILNPGKQYVVGDVLSAAAASLGGSGSGFNVPVSSTAINGSLAGGTVAMYVPNTTTPKQTWQDAAQTILNSNPISLDANGCATIYGTGLYRQVLSDSLGDLVFDKVTTDTSASNSVFWAGLAGGTPNVITVTDTGFNGTDGSVINFTALATNTSTVTLNPSGFGAIPVLQDTTAGPVALTPGQIIQNNPVSVIFRASDNSFHLLNPPIQSASGANAPLCGAVGLKITNNTGTPNSIITVTAAQLVMQTPSGTTINRSNVSFNINITQGTSSPQAGGMDGESPGSAAWLYVFGIDNGSAPAGLATAASGQGLSPNMPSGYTFKCRLGAVRVDGSSNLLRTLQLGSDIQYTITAATNTNAMPQLVNVTSNAGSLTAPTWVPVSVTSAAPPTAVSIKIALNCLQGINVQNGPFGCMVAPNNNYGGTNATTDPPPLFQILQRDDAANLVTVGSQMGALLLESTNLYWACSVQSPLGGQCIVSVLGWKDAVNAN